MMMNKIEFTWVWRCETLCCSFCHCCHWLQPKNDHHFHFYNYFWPWTQPKNIHHFHFSNYIWPWTQPENYHHFHFSYYLNFIFAMAAMSPLIFNFGIGNIVNHIVITAHLAWTIPLQVLTQHWKQSPQVDTNWAQFLFLEFRHQYHHKAPTQSILHLLQTGEAKAPTKGPTKVLLPPKNQTKLLNLNQSVLTMTSCSSLIYAFFFCSLWHFWPICNFLSFALVRCSRKIAN